MFLNYEEITDSAELIVKAKFAYTDRFCKVSLTNKAREHSKIPLLLKNKEHHFGPCFLPIRYRDYGDKIYNLTIRSDDIWIISFPKCGTTWTQSMVWYLENNLNFITALNDSITDRVPFLELSALYNDIDVTDDSFEYVDKYLSSPRIIKSHLPVQLLPRQLWTVCPKIIYITRNPKDAAISFYHHYRNIDRYEGSYEDYMEAFLNNFIIFAPFHQHVLDFWQLRMEPNVLFLTYEEMLTNHFQVIKRTSKFLKKSYADEELESLRNHLTIDSMRSNPFTNYNSFIVNNYTTLNFQMPDCEYKFIRKGKCGTFREEMSSELIKRFDDWAQENLENSDFQYAA